MPNCPEATTPQVDQPGNKATPTPYRPSVQWTPRYDEFMLSVPVAWQCPCGGLVHTTTGRICCPDCGRIPRDTVPRSWMDRRDAPQVGRGETGRK